MKTYTRGKNYWHFLTKNVDVYTGYVINQAIKARQSGHEINIIYPDDYDIHICGDSIFTTETMIEGNPGLVERFVRTSPGLRLIVMPAEDQLEGTVKFKG